MQNVVLKGLTKRYGEVTAVDNIDLEIKEKRDPRVARTQRLWENDHPSLHRRIGISQQRRNPDR